MSTLLLNSSPAPLKVWPIFREAFAFSWDHRGVLWRWIVVGAFLAGLVNFVDLFGYGEEDEGLTGLQYFVMILLTPIPSLLVFALLAVYCHRTFLIYDGGNDYQIRFFFTERERKFFAWVIGVPLGAILFIVSVFLAVALIVGQISESYQGSFWEGSFPADLHF